MTFVLFVLRSVSENGASDRSREERALKEHDIPALTHSLSIHLNSLT